MPLFPPTSTVAASGVSRYGRTTRTGGTVTFNSTTWANLDTGTDITLNAAAGNVILVGISALVGNEAAPLDMDVATIVSGSVVSYASGMGGAVGDRGISAWSANNNAQFMMVGTPFPFTLVSGDISAGTVTLRVRAHIFSGVSKTVFATSALPFVFWAWNLG